MLRKLIFAFTLLSIGVSAGAQQLVLRGDYPDPSVVKIGDTYWASATTSNWAPAYPILKSKDLVNWTTVSHVFMKLPDWADYYFWAPEITYDNGKVYLYYAAHKKGGNLCIAVASADRPEGPYTDHGPLMCETVGSIDAFPMRDEKGKLYMIWKEDGNSVNKPTSIWAMEMNEERTKLLGEKKELFRNDAGWEGNLVEGVSMVKNGDYYYAFYAGAGCCGAGCTYATGIARSKNLLGPWEKYQKNPILSDEGQWKCPGHGTPVERNGKNYFMYHAYAKNGHAYTGREGLIIEYKFTPDGWVEFIKDDTLPAMAKENFDYGFREKNLAASWQWSVFHKPGFRLKGGELHLTASPGLPGSFLGHKTISADYTATVKFHHKKSTASQGLSVIGDENNMVTLFYDNSTVKLVQLRQGRETVLAQKTIAEPGKKAWAQVKVVNGGQLRFFYGTDPTKLQQLNIDPVDGSFLPPWDRALRVGIVAKGSAGTKAVFDSFELISN